MIISITYNGEDLELHGSFWRGEDATGTPAEFDISEIYYEGNISDLLYLITDPRFDKLRRQIVCKDIHKLFEMISTAEEEQNAPYEVKKILQYAVGLHDIKTLACEKCFEEDLS